MLDQADIARRLHLGEDSRWEFKQIAFRDDRPVEPRSGTWPTNSPHSPTPTAA